MCSNNCVNGVVELDYVVLKLNGSDMTTLTRYDAVQMFLQAKETIVVELCRKQNASDTTSESEICAQVNGIQLQTDASGASDASVNCSQLQATGSKNQIILTLRALANTETTDATPSQNVVGNKAVSNMDIVQSLADHFIEQEHNLFEQCLEPDIDIEEIRLTIDSATSDEFGVTFCGNSCIDRNSIIKTVICNQNTKNYTNTNTTTNGVLSADDANVTEEVFISDIQADSVADQDGRLRRGDQILRINGINIKSKAHAQAEMAASTKNVTMLVSRLLYPEDDDDEDEDEDDDDEDEVDVEVIEDEDAELDSHFEYANSLLSEDYTNVVDKLNRYMHLKSGHRVEPEPAAIQIRSMTSSSADPTINKRQEPNICKEEPVEDKCSNQTQTIVKRLPAKNAAAKCSQYVYDECEHIYETIPEDSESEPLYCSPYQSSSYMTATGSCSSPMFMSTEASEVLDLQQQTQRVAQWLGLKSQIHPQTVHTLAGRPCFSQKQRSSKRVLTLRSALTNTSGSSSSATNVENEHKSSLNQEEVDNSSSAYNTGGSNNSASPRQTIPNIENDVVSAVLMNPLNATGTHQSSCTPSGKPAPRIFSSQFNTETALVNNEGAHPFASALTAYVDAKVMRPKPAEEQQIQCPQFNAPNLSRYHFVSSQEVSNKTVTVVQPKSNSILVAAQNTAEEIPMVWKVKRRPDGTRYIVKRPVRSNVRKSVRCNEVTTTEDDTISEVKIGRYWTKEERKRHIERARERRHHHQQSLQQQQQKQQFSAQ